MKYLFDRRVKIFATAMVAMLLIATCSSGPLVQAAADKEVRRLCAIDGGVKVYETVTLPAERFDNWGNVIGLQIKGNAKPTDDYYSELETQTLQDGNLRIVRVVARVLRRSDAKVLGESVRYGRGGGDVPGPWHPSTYDCPSIAESTGKLQSSVFRQQN